MVQGSRERRVMGLLRKLRSCVIGILGVCRNAIATPAEPVMPNDIYREIARPRLLLLQIPAF